MYIIIQILILQKDKY